MKTNIYKKHNAKKTTPFSNNTIQNNILED